MLLKKYIFLFFFLLLLPLNIYAQFVNFGSDPARFKWSMVKLPHYNLVYPQGLDSMAYRYALYLENSYPYIQNTIGKPMKAKFPVILHPANMSSNGMVSWAPRRMELITTPSIRSDAQRWDKHLVLHESRHVFQTGKVMRGWFKPLYYLIGEQAAGVAAFFLPTWFLEGDAVSTETAMSNAGRGRLPEFNMTYRAQMLAGDKFYSFDKWYLGSYKDYVGDFYALGYNLTSFARFKYGADIWNKTTTRYVSHFFAIPMFSNALKHHSGSSVDKLFDDTFLFLKEKWQKQDTTTLVLDYISPDVTKYTSYRYPQSLNDSVIIAVKSGIQDINSLVSIINGYEKRLTYIGTINSRIILKNNRVYWTEIVPGLRWTHENFSVLKYYDLTTKRTVTLTPRQRYLAPSLDNSGKTIAVSRFTIHGENQIILLNAETGKEITHYFTPNNVFVKELTFDSYGNIAAVTVNDTGIELYLLNTQSGRWNKLLDTTPANITSPDWQNGKLFFESGLNGTNNIYYLDTLNRQTYRLTSSRFGAFNPTLSTDKKKLIFSDYQSKGYRIASIPVDSLYNEKADFKYPYRFQIAERLAEQEQFNLDSATLMPVEFDPKPYRKAIHTFKIHSWAPFYYDVNEAMNASADDFSTIIKPGAMLLTQNTLNTAIGQAGWYYRDGYHHGKIAFNYMGWFPIINLDIDYGGKAFDITWVSNDQGKEVTKGNYSKRNLLEAEAQIYFPFNLTKNYYIRGIQPSVSYYFTNNKYQQYNSRKFRNFQYILSEIRFYNYRRMAHRDILPRLGYQLRLQYLNTPFNTENYGNLYTGRLTTYWPGIIPNHSLMLRAAYQYQDIDNKALYIPKRLIEKTRGYDYLYQTRQQFSFKADYAFSLISPDLSLGQLMYIRRIRTNLFYDITRNQSNKNSGWTTQSSYGADLIFDWNVIRMSFPLTTGVRFIQPIDYGKLKAELLFSISF